MENTSNLKLKHILANASINERLILWKFNCVASNESQPVDTIIEKLFENGRSIFMYYLLNEHIDYLKIVRTTANKLKIIWYVEETEERIEKKIIIALFLKEYPNFNKLEKENIDNVCRSKFNVDLNNFSFAKLDDAQILYLAEVLVDRSITKNNTFEYLWKASIPSILLELSRPFGLVGLAGSLLYIINDLLRPDYKAMTLSVLYVAYLRLKQSKKE